MSEPVDRANCNSLFVRFGVIKELQDGMRFAMLRITKVRDDGVVCELKFEGKLLAHEIEVLDEACKLIRSQTIRLRLDLSGLSYADASGAVALRELIRQGAKVTTSSPFIAQLLEEYR